MNEVLSKPWKRAPGLTRMNDCKVLSSIVTTISSPKFIYISSWTSVSANVSEVGIATCAPAATFSSSWLSKWRLRKSVKLYLSWACEN
jgi:hypothetical protein